LVFLITGALLRAADYPSLKSHVSSNTAQVGEAIRLIVEVSNVKSASPPAVVADGLEIRFRGESTQVNMTNGNFSRKQVYTYAVMAAKEGSYTIPAIEMEAEGQKLKTQPIAINIEGGSMPSPGNSDGGADASKSFFAEIHVDKKELYVGETIPIEFRLYIREPATGRLTNNPQLTGEGFSVQPFGHPSQRGVQLEGKQYGVAQFMSLITATKAGKLTLGPISVPLLVQTPERNSGIYDQFFGGNLGPAREIKLEAPAIEVEVKPLPQEGRPEGFSGAIGKFEFEAAGSPGKIQAGQPVEMKLWIRGQGNFDRIGVPDIQEPDHWQVYPPGDAFEASDRLGYGGSKVFTQNVIPKVQTTSMPSYVFSYFDPEQKKYATISSRIQPLVVVGVIAPVVEESGPSSSVEKQEEAKPVAPDILGISPLAGNVGTFGISMSYGKLFTLLFLPLPFVLAIVGWHFRKPNPEIARKKALREEIGVHMKAVRDAKEIGSVVDAAVHVLQCHISLLKGGMPSQIEDAQIIEVGVSKGDLEKKLKQLFARRSELLYMGAGSEGGILRTEREQLLELMSEFERSVSR